MQYSYHLQQLVFQLTHLLRQLTEEQYSQKIPLLKNASIGQHIRHTIEFFEELENGYHFGVVNYDNRQRNLLLETDKIFAEEILNAFPEVIKKPDREIRLEVRYSNNGQTEQVLTSYQRELVYVIEHTVHHMAIIRSALSGFPSVILPDSFGIAASTLRYKNACAQ